MLAIRKIRREQNGLSLCEENPPVCGPAEVRIQVKAAAICGSDLHAYQYHSTHHYMSVPVTMGHECAGVVIQKGQDVLDINIGDTVVADAVLACGSCLSCLQGKTNLCERFEVRGMKRDGVFAEQFVTNARYVYPISSEVPFPEAALAEPLAVALHAAASVHQVSPGEVHLITGPGPLGLLTALCIQLQGAEALIAGTKKDEKNRFPVCEKAGVSTIISEKKAIQSWLENHTGKETVDGWIECSGAAGVFEFVPDLVKKGGVCTVQGLYNEWPALDMTRLVRREISIRTSCAYRPEDIRAAVKLLERKRIDVSPLIRTYTFEQFQEAFNDALKQKVMKSVFVNKEETDA